MLASAMLTTLLLAASPSRECIEIRNVRSLAQKNGLDDSALRTLETQYCEPKGGKTSSVAAPPASLAGKSPVCIEALMIEQLAAVDPEKESQSDTSALRQTACGAGGNAAEVRYDSGRLARSSTGVWSFPSGRLARAIGGPWLYPDGKIAGKAGGLWNYPNGQTARYSDGSWKMFNGPTSSLAEVVAACRKAGACNGPSNAPDGGEDVFAAWVARELWAAETKK